MQTFLSFILVFGIIVLVHEFGHFYFAKRAGVLVREFSIGMGPKLFQTHKNETTYTLRALPLGGYVMMAGFEEENDIRLGQSVRVILNELNEVIEVNLSEDKLHTNGIPIDVIDYDFEHDLFLKGNISDNTNEPVTFQVKENAILIDEDGTKLQIAPADRQIQNASLIDRVLTNFGGPLSNFILAIFAFILLAFIRGGVPTEEPILGNIETNSPAEEAQLKEGDRILSIDDKKITSWIDMVAYVQEHPDESLNFKIQHSSDEIYTKKIIPKSIEVESGDVIGQIGVQSYLKTSFMDKITFGFTETWFNIKSIFSSIILLFTGQVSMDELGGPVAIYSLTDEITQTAGFLGIINFIGFLSINLGLMNLLPIPALDGGKLALNILEAIRGKPISQNKEMIISIVGVVILLLLMLFITWNDIHRYFLN